MKLLSKIPKKALIAAATTGTVIAVGVAVAIPKEESYRTIQVYDIEGTAQVTREEIGLMDAYVNMQLQNKKINFLGDSITEGSGASEHPKCYVSQVADLSGAVCRNYGIGGIDYIACFFL